jgi:hypothetical protein
MVETEMAIVRRRDFSVWMGDAVGVGVRAGLWEVEGLELKAAEPIKMPTTPVSMSFCMIKGAVLTFLECPFHR